MPVTSAYLAQRYGCSGSDLRRWTEYGWIAPEQPHGQRGSGSRLTWPRWAERVVALLTRPGEAEHRKAIGASSGAHRGAPGTPLAAYSEMVCAVADALMDEPEALWLVLVDGQAWPCDTAEEVVEVLPLAPGPLRMVVSPAA